MAGASKMFLKMKSSLKLTFQRSSRAPPVRRSCLAQSLGVGVSSVGDPTCTTMESWEPSAVIGESGKGGSSAALSLIILVDQLVTNFSPGSSEGFPSRIQSACGH